MNGKLGLIVVVGQTPVSFEVLTGHENHMPICNEEACERLLDKRRSERRLATGTRDRVSARHRASPASARSSVLVVRDVGVLTLLVVDL